MKRVFLAAFGTVAALQASAVFMLPEPEQLTHDIKDKQIDLTWHNMNTDEKITHYHVIVYKTHEAKEHETFVLADNDFSYINSVGTINQHEHRGGGWANVEGSPGWYVKSPKYMDGAVGIDTYFYYAGSDNDDYFGGAYMLSPHYSLRGLTDPTLHVSASLAAEAVSVTGGFCIYAWSADFWTEGREHYIPLTGDLSHDHHYDDLSTTNFQNYAEDCTVYDNQPEIYNDRVRVCFYGRGYSMYWVDNMKVTVDMEPGDRVRYAVGFAQIPAVKGEMHSYTIDTSADTDYDYVDGYQVRGVRIDPYTDIDTGDTNDYIRFISPDNVPEVILQRGAGVNENIADGNDASIHVSGGTLYVESLNPGLTADVYDMQGVKVLTAKANTPVAMPNTGLYIVKAGGVVKKVMVK